MQKKDLKKIFKLEGYILDKIEENEGEILLHCHVQKKSMKYNGEISKHFFVSRIRKIQHQVLEKTVVYIVIKARKFYFSKQRVQVWEKLPNIEKNKQTSNEFRLNTLRELQRDNYSGTAGKRGVSGQFVANLLDSLDYELKWTGNITKIGIDGKWVKRKGVLHHLVDLDTGKSICVIPNLKRDELRDKLMKIPQKDRFQVSVAVSDMDYLYIGILKECFPKARIVVDHFHVIAWGIKLLQDLKRGLQDIHGEKFKASKHLKTAVHKLKKKDFEKLNSAFQNFDELKRAWKIIHQLRRIYWQKNWKKAESQLRYVIWLCKQSCIPEMQDLSKTLILKKEYILNYYISKSTNAKTEALHGRFENMKRQHCGIRNMERFTKKLMFSLLPFLVLSEICFQRF